jgi:hypothetical protein
MSETQVPLIDDTHAQRWAHEFMEMIKDRFKPHGGLPFNDDAEGTMLAWFANAIETGRRAGREQGTAGWAEYFQGCQLYEVHGRYHDERFRQSVGCMAYVVADSQERAKQGFLDANKDRKDLKVGICTVRSYGNRQLVIV